MDIKREEIIILLFILIISFLFVYLRITGESVFSSEDGCDSGILTQDIQSTDLINYTWKCGTTLCSATTKEIPGFNPSYAIDGHCDNINFVGV